MRSLGRLRDGFTLMEILVSIMIFSVVSLAMVLVLKQAVTIFQGGERSRQAFDEATATLAALDDDLRRMIPVSAGGFMFARNADWASNSPNAFACKMMNPRPDEIGADGQAARIIVVWWQDREDRLHRAYAAAPESNPRGIYGNPTTNWDMVKAIYAQVATPVGLTDPTVFADGCLHFGIDVHGVSHERTSLAWNFSAPPLVSTTAKYNSDDLTTPSPTAVRLSLIFAGSRHRLQGRLVKQLDQGEVNQALIGGVKNVPLGDEAFARIGDPAAANYEWIRYEAFQAGRLQDLRRGQLKTEDMGRASGDPVAFGRLFTLVRNLE